MANVDDLVDYETHFAHRGSKNDSRPAHRSCLVSAIILSGRTPDITFKLPFFSKRRFLSLMCQKQDYCILCLRDMRCGGRLSDLAGDMRFFLFKNPMLWCCFFERPDNLHAHLISLRQNLITLI